MKINRCLFGLLLAGILLASCEKTDMAYENDFDRSYKSWMDFKAASGNSYRYQVQFGSWTGFSAETVITIKNGKPVQRSYVAKSLANDPSREVTIHEQWEEDESSLNAHSTGYAALTLDEIYERAKSDWLLKRKDAKTYLETKNAGMISSCGFVNNGCQDDCFEGINIGYIEKL